MKFENVLKKMNFVSKYMRLCWYSCVLFDLLSNIRIIAIQDISFPAQQI